MKNARMILSAAALCFGAASCAPTSSTIEPGATTGGASAATQRPGAAVVTEPNVKEAERVLQALGYNPGRVDGEMDRQTQQALRAFQDYNNIPQTGQLDVMTAEKLAERGANFVGMLDKAEEGQMRHKGPAYIP